MVSARKGFRQPLVGVWLCLLASAPAEAGLPTAPLEVAVVDEGGLGVPGADVELRCAALAGSLFHARLTTDENGLVRFPGVPSGDACELLVGRAPLAPVRLAEIRVGPDQPAHREVVLRSAAGDVVVGKELLAQLPPPRSYQAAVEVTAGVTRSPGGGAPVAQPRGTEEYEHPGFHDTRPTDLDRLSTFAIDVDTASYALARVKLRQGDLPDPASVRVEEFVNAFPYEIGPGPRGGPPLGIRTEVARHPLREGSVLLSVTLQSRSVPVERRPLHLTFLVDVSGSMVSADKIGLVRDALHHLTDGLGDEDEIALVTYAGATRVVLEPTWTTRKDVVHGAIDGLQVGGGTAMGDGLDLAYRMAERMGRDGVENRVIVLTDGDANVGRATTEELEAIVAARAGEGIGLSVVGVGQGNYKDARLERLADHGDGNYHYVDSREEAARVFGRDLVANLTTLARDVKVQVEFPDSAVLAWRQVGYENRELADEEFRDDDVDGGEVGYGHQVTALYELDLRGHPKGDLVRVAVRAEPPGREAPAIEFTATHPASDPIGTWEAASPALRWASATATFAEVLRGSPVEAETGWGDVLRLVDGALDRDRGDQAEMRDLVLRAAALSDQPEARARVAAGDRW